jgi:hypothetical protein
VTEYRRTIQRWMDLGQRSRPQPVEPLPAFLSNPIKFWSCRHCLDEGRKPVISWDGDVASCAFCGRTNQLITAQGTVLTDEVLSGLVQEAEMGYDLDRLSPRDASDA